MTKFSVQIHHIRAQALEHLQWYDEACAAHDLVPQIDLQDIRLLAKKAALQQQLRQFSEALSI